MTTATFTTALDNSTDAAFRVWGQELNTQFAAIGIVQTADTGQINWTTVTRAATNIAAGYEIWRFADSTLFMKIEYGTGGSATAPMLWITVGTGSNGSGTLTGQTSTRNKFAFDAPPNSTVTNYTSYLCRTADAFALAWKVNAASNLYPMAFVVVGKTVDGTGAATTTGFGILRAGTVNTPASFQSVRTVATAATFLDTIKCCMIPGEPTLTTATAAGSTQAYEVMMNVPDVQPFLYACGVMISEAAKGGTISVAMVSVTAHTYLSLGALNGTVSVNNHAGTVHSYAMIFE